MRGRASWVLSLAACACLLAPARADTVPEVKLWKLDCGMLDENAAQKQPWQKQPTPTPCFLIRHGDRYLLWDTGVSARAISADHPVIRLDKTMASQLAALDIAPAQITFVGISHYHGDHTGQASQFPAATLLIGAGDLAALKSPTPPTGAAPSHIEPWLAPGAKVEALTEDRDVFGDGTVTVLMTPCHTPGHTSLLVKLASGPVILTGDLWFSHQDALRGTMPDFNSSRAETLASRERIARLAEKLDAAIIIQHEAADLAKLPDFPTPLD